MFSLLLSRFILCHIQYSVAVVFVGRWSKWTIHIYNNAFCSIHFALSFLISVFGLFHTDLCSVCVVFLCAHRTLSHENHKMKQTTTILCIGCSLVPAMPFYVGLCLAYVHDDCLLLTGQRQEERGIRVRKQHRSRLVCR